MSEWRPSAGMEALLHRAALLTEMRGFFQERGAMEVETPLLCAHGAADPHLASFSTCYIGPGAPRPQTLYLQTSPEFAMKRLLAAGSGPIYQIGKAFRNGEAGRFHNPEFTLLEWYRPGLDYHALMDEVDALLQHVLHTPPAVRITYADIFRRHTRLDPHGASVEAMRACAEGLDIQAPASLGTDREAWITLLWTHVIEPRLKDDACPVFVYDYPVGQAMLARIRPGELPVAERFELYVQGVELANGFQELSDGAEQRTRFEANCRERQERGLEPMQLDERLLSGLAYLPFCSGVALGVDRLLMLKTGAGDLQAVLAFPVGCA